MKEIFLPFLILLFIFSSCDKSKKKLNYIDLEDDIKQKIVNKKALIYFDKGEEYFKDSKFDSAIVNFTKSLNFEKNTLTYNQIGLCEGYKENFDKSIEFHKLGIKADSTNYTNYLNIARTYIAKNELGNAEEYLEKTLKINNSEYSVALANLHLTIVYFNQNRDCSEIKNQFKKAEILEYDNKMGEFYEFSKNKIEKRCK